MEFGKLEDISNVHWRLPPDDEGNSRLRPSDVTPKIYLGSPAWGNKHWVGKIYPKKTSPSDFLHHYSRQFNAIELNTTHYRIPDMRTAQEWLSQVPPEFQFCPKVPKAISHTSGGLLDQPTLKVWFDFLNELGGNLGCSFIQFHEAFSYENRVILFRFLENWPKEFKLALEFRHPSWFQQNKILPALTDYLHRKQMALVITDVAGRRDVLHSSLSTNWTMIRLIGNDLHESDSSRLKEWSERLSKWKKQGLSTTYLMLHQPDDILTLEFGQLAHKIFQENGHSEVPELKFHQDHDLFSTGL